MEGVNGVDYLGWELERQQEALLALLGSGKPENTFGEDHSAWEESSGWGGELPTGGTRRSPEDLEKAQKRGSGESGRYAAGRGEAEGPPVGTSGFWGMVREAAEDRLGGENGIPDTPVSAREGDRYAEAEVPARERRSAETSGSLLPQRYASEEIRRTSRVGTGGAAELRGPSGGQRGREVEWETAADFAAEAELAAGTTRGRRAERNSAAAGPLMGEEKTPLPGESSGRDAGAIFDLVGRSETLRPGGDKWTKAAGQGGRLSRSLPWSGGWESTVLQAEDGAKALSRAVQRDARRYDGGFTIY